MRSDTLAQILTLSNVHALSNLVVMETCQGLIVGSMLERMGGNEHLKLEMLCVYASVFFLPLTRLWEACTSVLWRLSC